MKVHVYKVVEKYVVDTHSGEDTQALQDALASVKACEVASEEPECEFIAVVPGGQETVA